MTSKTIISGEEFVNKTLAGERDFSNTRFLRKNRLHHRIEGYQSLLAYLHETDLASSPLILNGAYWSHVKAPKLYAPHTIAKGTKFTRCNFLGGNFDYADFTRAKFRATDVNEFSAINARLEEVTFESPSFYKVRTPNENFGAAFQRLLSKSLVQAENGNTTQIETHRKVSHNLARIALENLRRKDSMSLGNIK